MIDYIRIPDHGRPAECQSQYRASKNVNAELIALYFGIGKYISDNTRDGYWGTGALAVISERLKRSMPGLRGYSEGNMKKMRIFYEKWSAVIDNSCVTTHEFVRILN
ncbi:MAG: DUF1016 N-terminal domain-containing protein [Candidatus Cryptobacteroides sp.]